MGQRVAKEVARLRGRIPVRELSARLKALGRPILPSGITKIEQGQRRVDVDDLVALAVALEVTPTRLLLGPPPTDGTFENPAHDEIYETHEGPSAPFWSLRLLPDLALEPWEVWGWALGEQPLGEIWKLATEGRVIFQDPEMLTTKFRAENALPPLQGSLGAAESIQEAVTDIDDAVKDALDQGLTAEQISRLVQGAISSWSADDQVRRENKKRYRRLERGMRRAHERFGKGD